MIDVREIHRIVKRKKQKPKYCEICNEYKKRIELSSINHTYTNFPKDYMYLCSACHSLYDNLKGLRIFTKEQKEYTWKMVKKLKLHRIKHVYIVNKKRVLTTLHKNVLSKSWYYIFKLNEKEIMENRLV